MKRERYIAEGSTVLDAETSLIIRYETVEAARLTAEMLNVGEWASSELPWTLV